MTRPSTKTAHVRRLVFPNVRLHACTDGDTGRAQLLWFVPAESKMQLAGKRVKITVEVLK